MATSDVFAHDFDEENGKTISADSCPECSGRLHTDGGEISCTECGLVIDEERFDHGHRRYYYEDGDTDPRRTGAPLTPARHDRGLSTEIGRRTDANGNTISGRKRRQLGRLRREHSRGRWQSKAERNLGRGLTEVRRIASALGLAGSVRNQSCLLFRSAQTARLLPGRSIEAMAGASVYATFRCNDLPWTLGDVCAVSRVARGRVENAYTVLNRELGLPAVPPSPRQYVPRLAADLSVSDQVRRIAERLATQATAAGLANGRNPAGVAAGCLYEAAQHNGVEVTQHDLGEYADVSTATIRSRWEEVRTLDSCE